MLYSTRYCTFLQCHNVTCTLLGYTGHVTCRCHHLPHSLHVIVVVAHDELVPLIKSPPFHSFNDKRWLSRPCHISSSLSPMLPRFLCIVVAVAHDELAPLFRWPPSHPFSNQSWLPRPHHMLLSSSPTLPRSLRIVVAVAVAHDKLTQGFPSLNI